MIKRLSLIALLLVAGLVAGLVLSGTAGSREAVLARPRAEPVVEQAAAASAAPICNVAAAERVRIRSVDHCNADDEPNCVTALLNVFLPVHTGAIV